MDFTAMYGVYLADNGTCAPCAWAAPNCYSCHNLNATCTACTQGFVLVGSECQPW